MSAESNGDFSMTPYGVDPVTGHALGSYFVPDFAALADLRVPSAPMILLIAADATAVGTDTISLVAEHLLASGLAYVCAWGPDCERVHDIFDEVYVGDGREEPTASFMSTWHANQPLDEALWFLLRSAFPPDHEPAAVVSLAVSVAHPEWAESVNQALSDPNAFVARILADEGDAGD